MYSLFSGAGRCFIPATDVDFREKSMKDSRISRVASGVGVAHLLNVAPP